jgi:flavin-binding protein dodecin
MSVAIHKVIEVLSESDKSWEDAADRAVKDAAKSLQGIKAVYVKNFQADVKDNKIVKYRINSKITFEVGG